LDSIVLADLAATWNRFGKYTKSRDNDMFNGSLATGMGYDGIGSGHASLGSSSSPLDERDEVDRAVLDCSLFVCNWHRLPACSVDCGWKRLVSSLCNATSFLAVWAEKAQVEVCEIVS
jgi:hypothetical protein